MAKEESQSDEIPQQIGGEEAPSSVEVFFEKNKKSILVAVVAVIVSVFAGIVMQHRNQSSHLEAAQAFTGAKTIADYEAVSRDYEGTVAAGDALLLKADLEFKEGKVNESQATLTSFVTACQDHPRYFQGILALGVQAQARGNLDEADRYYQQVIDSDDAVDIAPLALIRKGDVAYARGDYESARSIYESVNPTYPDTPFAYKVQQMMAREKLRTPPPAPPAPPGSQASVPLIPAPAPAPLAPSAATVNTPPALATPAAPLGTVTPAATLATPPVKASPSPPDSTPIPPLTQPAVPPLTPPPAKPLPQVTTEPIPIPAAPKTPEPPEPPKAPEPKKPDAGDAPKSG